MRLLLLDELLLQRLALLDTELLLFMALVLQCRIPLDFRVYWSGLFVEGKGFGLRVLHLRTMMIPDRMPVIEPWASGGLSCVSLTVSSAQLLVALHVIFRATHG